MSYFDLDRLDSARAYRLLSSLVVPRPIAWTISRSATGAVNAAPYSFFNLFGGQPFLLAIGIGADMRGERHKDTLANILATRDFVVNLVSYGLREKMNITAVPFPSGVDELKMAGLETLPCSKVDLPRLAESPVGLECRLWKTLDIGAGATLVLAHILAAHVVDEAVADAERCYIDGSQMDLLGRMQSPSLYARTGDCVSLDQMSVQGWHASIQHSMSRGEM